MQPSTHQRPAGRRLLAACVLAALSPGALAYPVEVMTSVPVTTVIQPALGTMQATLGEILSAETETGTAVVQNADKVTTAVTEAARTQREAENFNRQADRLEKARASYTVPDSICSESASGTAAQVSQATRAAASKLAGGSGVSNAVVRETLASLPTTPRQGGYRSALIHAAYCTADEAKLYGGTGLCPSVSQLPGGDTEARSLYDGAGPAGKDPELTFTQAQTDAAMAYVNNSAKLDAGRTPGKGEIQTATGQEYQGLLTQYKAMQSAAMQPQLDMVAASQPQDATQAALTEARQAPSAESYFQQTASAQAKQTGSVRASSGSECLSAVLFPPDRHSDLTRRLMTCVMAFADDTGHFTGRTAGLGALAGQLWAGDLWSSIARWSRQYPDHPALQTARALLTLEGASDSVLAIRNRMEIFHHPHVAETFTGATGFRLSTLRQRPGQVIFLTPDIRCMESEDLTSVYGFLAGALQAMGALHSVTFSLVEPVLTEEGEPL